MVKRNNQRKTHKKAKLKKNDKLLFNSGDFLLRAHGNKKTKRNKKHVLGVPLFVKPIFGTRFWSHFWNHFFLFFIKKIIEN